MVSHYINKLSKLHLTIHGFKMKSNLATEFGETDQLSRRTKLQAEKLPFRRNMHFAT